MYQMSQGYSGGACNNCSSCGGCRGGSSSLERIATSEVFYQGSNESSINDGYTNMGGNVVHYEANIGFSGVGYGAGKVSNKGYGLISNDGLGISNILTKSYGRVRINNVLNYQASNHQIINNYKVSLKTSDIINNFLSNKINQSYSFAPNNFLKPNRISQKFIGEAEEIREDIEDTFRFLTGLEFPEDIRVQVCNPKQFRKFTTNPGVVGLSINRKEQGLISDIFILNDELDKVMLTVGHELGHVLSRSLSNSKDEEAKAFAFSFAWMKTIKENNIADLSQSIVFDNPARNGIHDVAFNFVCKLIKEGKQALELYWDLVGKSVMVPVCS